MTRKNIDVAGHAELVVYKYVLWRAGLPQTIVSDQRPVFTSKFWSVLYFHLWIWCSLSTAFHPQTDKQTERQNQTLEQYLCVYVVYQHNDWKKWLLMAEFAYNNSWNLTIGCSLFYALMEQNPKIHKDVRALEKHLHEVPAARDWADTLLKMHTTLQK